MDWSSLLVQVIGGGVGGNIVGALLKQANLGPVGNTIVGVIGGLIGGQVGAMISGAATGAAAAGGMDLGTMLPGLIGGGGGGAVLTAIVGLIKNAMAK
jgi:hypothetical protein